MVADPSDLVLGRSGDGVGDASAVTKAIKTYRDKTPTGQGALKIESTGGK
jgi:pilus assembly protein CpaD